MGMQGNFSAGVHETHRRMFANEELNEKLNFDLELIKRIPFLSYPTKDPLCVLLLQEKMCARCNSASADDANYFSGAVKRGALFEGNFYRDCFSSLMIMTCEAVTGVDVFSLCGEVGQLSQIIIPPR